MQFSLSTDDVKTVCSTLYIYVNDRETFKFSIGTDQTTFISALQGEILRNFVTLTTTLTYHCEWILILSDSLIYNPSIPLKRNFSKTRLSMSTDIVMTCLAIELPNNATLAIGPSIDGIND